MDLGVRISTSNSILAQQFEKAMGFWAEVLDLEWHEEKSQDCAIQVVDGTPAIFNFCLCLSARSQLPDRPAFQGWIAFNPRVKLTKEEMFMDSVHEIGHLLGLRHNPSESSIMFYLGLDKATSLDASDLEALAARHQLSKRILRRTERSNGVRVVVPRQMHGRSQNWLMAAVSRMNPFQSRSTATSTVSALPHKNTPAESDRDTRRVPPQDDQP
jgi:hypothetical protein